MKTTMSKAHISILLYLIFSVIYFIGGLLDNLLVQDIFDLLGGLMLCFAAFHALKKSKYFHRFLYWITLFIWTDYLCTVIFILTESEYVILPDRMSLPIEILFIFPSFMLIFISIEIIYLIRERLDFKFYFLNLFGITLFFAVLVYGTLMHRIPSNVMKEFINLYNVIDTLSLILLISLLATLRSGQLHRSILYTLLGIASFNIVDLANVFITSVEVSTPTLYVWSIIYTISPLILLFAFIDISKNPGHLMNSSVQQEIDETYQPLDKIRFQFFLCVFSIICLVTGFIDSTFFSNLNLILLIYYLVANSYLVSVQNKQNILRQHKLNTDLEETVKQKSIELLKQNIKLQDLVNRDNLTGAYNRRYLTEMLSAIHENAQIFAIDILQFSNINQIFGDSVGDEVLQYLYQTLHRLFPSQPIFRVDSNEFIILFRGNTQSVTLISQQIFTALKIPYQSEFYEIALDIAIGVATYQPDSVDADKPENLLAKVNFALQEVKTSLALPRSLVFDQALADKKYRNGLIQSLLDTINYDEEFSLHYQPQYTACGSKLIGVEALLRWNSPVLGNVPPSEFIRIAEETTTIIKIVDWTLKQACRQITLWNNKYDLKLKVGINISPKYIEQPGFYEQIEDVVRNKKLNIGWIDLEITETSLMHLDTMVISLFEKMSSIGITTSIDDFGTGYSSLSYIQNLKISKLKIAKELIDGLSQNPNDNLIVNAIIKMAQGLNIKTIAEGVETEEQATVLQNLGCDYIQGYYFGKPSAPDVFEKIHL